MLSLRNHVTLIGNIGTSTKVTTFENGNKVARFSLASDKEFRANNGKMKINTEWHKIFAWGNMAQFIEMYAEKGKKVAIHGRLVTRTFLTQTGKKQTVTEVELRNIIGHNTQITARLLVPRAGVAPGSSNVKVPATEALPPLRVAADSA